MAIILELDDYYELNALFKAVFSAKFSQRTIAPEVSGSPLVAKTILKLSKLLQDNAANAGFPLPKDPNVYKLEVLAVDHLYWPTLRAQLSEDGKWPELDQATKIDLLKNMVAPFGFSESSIRALMKSADEHFDLGGVASE